MKVFVCKDPKQLGEISARQTADILREAIAKNGRARVVLSTGASQFTMFEALVREELDWSRVEMFHLDEYVNMPITHIASFRKYLQERFVDKVHPGRVNYVDGSPESIAALTAELRSAPIDVGLIGIGQNAHIAFNDPPADFDTDEAYLVVTLDPACRRQQVHEGWFASVDEVPSHAVSMSVRQIMNCKRIISCVPYPEKAPAVKAVLENDVTNAVPGTILKTHSDFTLYADADSFANVDEAAIRLPEGVTMELERV